MARLKVSIGIFNETDTGFDSHQTFIGGDDQEHSLRVHFGEGIEKDNEKSDQTIRNQDWKTESETGAAMFVIVEPDGSIRIEVFVGNATGDLTNPEADKALDSTQSLLNVYQRGVRNISNIEDLDMGRLVFVEPIAIEDDEKQARHPHGQGEHVDSHKLFWDAVARGENPQPGDFGFWP